MPNPNYDHDWRATADHLLKEIEAAEEQILRAIYRNRPEIVGPTDPVKPEFKPDYVREATHTARVVHKIKERLREHLNTLSSLDLVTTARQANTNAQAKKVEEKIKPA